MQLACNLLADHLAQSSLIGRVDILVDTGLDDEIAAHPLHEHLFEALLDGGEFFGGQNADLGVGTGIGDGSTDVLGVDGAVEVDGFIVGDHEGVKTAGEAASPEHVGRGFGRGHAGGVEKDLL